MKFFLLVKNFTPENVDVHPIAHMICCSPGSDSTLVENSQQYYFDYNRANWLLNWAVIGMYVATTGKVKDGLELYIQFYVEIP